jgi:hypothetical protein
MTTVGTQDEEKTKEKTQRDLHWTPLCASKQK